MFNSSAKLIVGVIVAVAGFGGSSGVASADTYDVTPANGYQAADSVCGFHEESGGALWWNNCSDQNQLINIHRPWSVDQTYCVPAHKDEYVTSSQEFSEYPVGYTNDLTYIKDGC
ncbi:hypothetical protein [Nocardia sp. NBC_00403]|uniref:hypothetical protein n=1 Tax=Nocardia sp. NBC_00403 TaxID=2975990 RepID=UPI002E1F0496